ncbi:benzoate 1,2-dioxygenase small subunit [Brevundimonas sp. 3P9-tot-E]|jgi:benzoate/toluate 1,2-dioxygenase beta subunit|uniref:benzoate 1,2-dioxygenase small subunit n=1 Tax=Brevundimonas TaxID=41275 RepID=UPI00289D5954|nr:benzoate 1,2-dioxygenase small subunit [Brevundimonas diminuta]
MTDVIDTAATRTLTRSQVEDFLYREARLLDDRQWDEWITCYSPRVEYWMPAWDDDDQLVEDPQQHISLIYYPNRDGLEDRVFRIKTERSGASTPEPRTSHNISNVEITAQRDGEVEVRFNWLTLSHRYKDTLTFFGTSYYTLDTRGPAPLITRKKIVLKNDYIRQVIDVYHV